MANVIDAVIVKRKVEALGYTVNVLANPFNYRGDTRAPDVNFNEGFCRKKVVLVRIRYGEVTMLYVSPEQVIAAIEIVTTLNLAKHYYRPDNIDIQRTIEALFTS